MCIPFSNFLFYFLQIFAGPQPRPLIWTLKLKTFYKSISPRSPTRGVPNEGSMWAPTPVPFVLGLLLAVMVYSQADEMAHLSFGGTRCPRMCSCVGSTVDCSRRGLTAVPRNIPLDTERMWVVFCFYTS